MNRRALLARAHAGLVGFGVLAGAVVCAAMIWLGIPPGEVLFALGFVFVGGLIGSAAVSGRRLDVSWAIVAIWGGSFGFWFSVVHAALDAVAPMWAEAMPWLPEGMALMLPVGAAVLAAGVVTGIGLGIVTDSLRVMTQTVIAGIGAASGSLLISHGDWTLMVAMVGWQALVGFELARWSLAEAMKKSGFGCPHCGTDIRDMSTPICPKCHKAMHARAAAQQEMGFAA